MVSLPLRAKAETPRSISAGGSMTAAENLKNFFIILHLHCCADL
jgi:hypothetical protein